MCLCVLVTKILPQCDRKPSSMYFTYPQASSDIECKHKHLQNYVVQKQTGIKDKNMHNTRIHCTLACLLLTVYLINGNNSTQQGLQRSQCGQTQSHCFHLGRWHQCVCFANTSRMSVLYSNVLLHRANLYCKGTCPHTPINTCWIKPDLPTEQPPTL